MDQFMVLCTFRQGTVMSEVFAVVADEQAAVARLTEEGRLGEIRLSMARGAVFIEAFAESAEHAADVVASLPMARWWDIDVFPIAAPPVQGGAA
ncbi:MAG: muconolactone Delta-isomerase family protein [Ilumatobacteraceae bacterium]